MDIYSQVRLYSGLYGGRFSALPFLSHCLMWSISRVEILLNSYFCTWSIVRRSLKNTLNFKKPNGQSRFWSTWHNIGSSGKKEAQVRKCFHEICLWAGHFVGSFLIHECLEGTGVWCCPCTGGPGLDKKAGRASHEKQVCKQCSSMTST